MNLYVNGKEMTFDENEFPENITALLAHLKVDETTVVAELQGDIIPKDKFADTQLEKGSKVELVRFVPGG